ncbi:hypothetical protein Tco_1305475 [Tanacetum coccineum]
MKVWKGCLEATAKKEGQGGVLFSSSLQGGDGGACKLLGKLLGDVIEEVEEVFHEHILSLYYQAKTDTTKGASTPYDTVKNV